MTEKESLEKSQKAFADFFQLCKFLFGDDAPYDVNEIPKDNPYYQTAKDIADEMGVDWEDMEHEDSNRIMLNILGEYFDGIKVDDEHTPVLTISFKKP